MNFIKNLTVVSQTTFTITGGIDEYVERVVEGVKVVRKDTSDEMRKAGFDIKVESGKLLEFYERFHGEHL